MTNDVLSKAVPDKSHHSDELTLSVEIVVISVKTATERRQKIEAMFDGTGLRWSYFDAHTAFER